MSLADQRAKAEARATPRRRTLVRATIHTSDFDQGRPCRVRDISEGGARLEVDGAADLPERFLLTIDAGNGPALVEVAWRGESVVGVAFLP